jgi:hypothetical protein
MIQPVFVAFLAILATPLISLARTYDVMCSDTINCKVEISYERLIVEGRIIPIGAISSWSKSGPGAIVNPTIGPILNILRFGAIIPIAIPTEYQAKYTITYYTAERKKDKVSLSFLNEQYSRWFEIELQAATSLPQHDVNDQAPLFKWDRIEYLPPPSNTMKNP